MKPRCHWVGCTEREPAGSLQETLKTGWHYVADFTKPGMPIARYCPRHAKELCAPRWQFGKLPAKAKKH